MLEHKGKDPLDNSVRYCMDVSSLPRAYSGVLLRGDLRTEPADFFVEENLGFELSGHGEHAFLFLEKTCLTTHALREAIARLASCHPRDVGYAGLKDKHAVTRQWFSVYLPGKSDPDWTLLEQDARLTEKSDAYIKLLLVTRHSKKLKIGVHKSNSFSICLKEVKAAASEPNQNSKALETLLEQRLLQMSKLGIPNYFGEQRFGFGGANVEKALSMFVRKQRISRNKRSLYLSAARSFLFNQQLASRISDASWSHYIDGDTLMLEGTHSLFELDENAQDYASERSRIGERLNEGDIHIGGMMYGEGFRLSATDSSKLEQNLLDQYSELSEGLKHEGIKASRRALRVMPKDLKWTLDNQQLSLSFQLPVGSYATAFIRELADY